MPTDFVSQPDSSQPAASATALVSAGPLHILLIEDEPALAQNVLDYLALQGHQLDYARDGAQGLLLAQTGQYDLILLDLMLPRLDGLALCQQLRAQQHSTPVLMLTARDTLDDKLAGFAAGADDYLTKPFALAELAVRCQALARRRQGQQALLTIGPLQLNRQTRQVWRDQQLLPLNPACFALLQVLAEHYPAVVPRALLLEKLWPDEPPESDSLRSHLYLLRQQLDKPFSSAMLCTVHGVGVQLVLPTASNDGATA